MMEPMRHRFRVHRDYVFPASGERRSPEDYPYGYDPYFVRGSRADIKGASSRYSDRFPLWFSREQLDAARKVAVTNPRGDCWWRNATLPELTRFLNELGQNEEAVAVAEGCNVSNGYPYWIVWSRPSPPQGPSND